MQSSKLSKELEDYARSIEQTPSKWVEFHMYAHTGKTFHFTVWTEGQQIMLGAIKWFGRWRRYSFFPNNDTVFEWDCMRTISDVCEKMTKDHGRQILAKSKEKRGTSG